MSSLMRAYTRSFERSPYLNLLVANACLSGLGDFTAQTLAGSSAMYDTARTARFVLFGASMGPLAGAWNRFLEYRFPLRTYAGPGAVPMQKVKAEDPPMPIPGFKMPKGAKLERGPDMSAGSSGGKAGAESEVSALALAKRVMADQLGMAPVGLFIFLTSMGVMEGLSDEDLYAKIKANYLPILLVNWQVWPLLQLINFRYVPLKYRVPFGSLLGILWTCFLSFKTNQSKLVAQVN